MKTRRYESPEARAPQSPPSGAGESLKVRQVPVDERGVGQRLDNFLGRILAGVPKTHIFRVIRKGEVRVDVKHVVAVANEEDADGDRTFVYLSDVPLDAKKIAAAFHASSAAEEQLGEGSAGYVRICIDAQGGECGLYFSHNKPTASFNSSGYGEFKLLDHVLGRHHRGEHPHRESGVRGSRPGSTTQPPGGGQRAPPPVVRRRRPGRGRRR